MLACHAEKQPIAYFIGQHVFLDPEVRAPKKAFGYPDILSVEYEYEEEGTLY